MDASAVIAAIALVLSLFTLGWQLNSARWERPVIHVTGTVYTDASNRSAYRINVTNVGEKPVTLIAAGWLTHKSESSRAGLGVPDAFPMRLEPFDTKTWDLSEDFRKVPNAVDEPWVRLVQRPTWREQRKGIAAERTVYGKLVQNLSPF